MRISYVPLILLHTNTNQYSRMIAKTDVALAKVLTKRWLESVIAFMDFLWGHYYSLPSLLKALTKRFTRWTNRRLFVGEISGRCHHYQRVGGRAVDWIEEGGYWLVSNTASQRIADIKTSGMDSTPLLSLSLLPKLGWKLCHTRGRWRKPPKPWRLQRSKFPSLASLVLST